LYFNRGGYSPPPPPDIPFERFTQTTLVDGPREFVDVPRMQSRRGTLLVDAAHRNAFNPAEIVTLLSRVANRGYDVEFAGAFSLIEDEKRIPLLEDRLRHAGSFLIILPREPYQAEDIALLERFVARGGRLLLIADPTRPHEINTVGEPFGLEFQPDYLFNQVEYDLNFQHIIVRDFQPDELTSGLNEIVLYTAGSVKSSAGGLAFADTNTQSSVTGTDGPAYAMATGDGRNVLAIYDLTFMIPPNNSSLDNNRLISNIADYLTDSERVFELGDFPSFFKGDVDILLGQPSMFDAGTKLKSAFSGMGVPSKLSEREDIAADTVFLGLYQDSPAVLPYLESHRVMVGDESLGIPSAAEIPVEDTAIIALSQVQDRQVLLVLAESPEGLKKAIDRLTSGDFRAGLVNDFVGVYKTR
ncbi:MAG TPA: DUF4350 domain-containing protein, partial [Dehalococcoidia bacterium]|nr:DUF4350 domain-containing protein [Dehalococcoidia bacterium]